MRDARWRWLVGAAFAGSVLLAACGDRQRPTGLEDDPGVALLTVVLDAPSQGTVHMAGASIQVAVRASEPLGRLAGAGFEARLNSFEPKLVDSVQVSFTAIRDTTVTFTYIVPDSFPNNVQIDYRGVAFGVNGERAVSVPRSTLVIR